MVACRSSMHLRRADWVFGVARLISSARTTWAMIGPGRNSNSWVFWLKIERPVTSDGSRSGVNWMRRKLQPMLWLSALASIVLPTPGTSSMRMWPSQRSATSAIRTSLCLPTMTRSTLATTRSAGCWTFFTAGGSPSCGCGRTGPRRRLWSSDNTPARYGLVHARLPDAPRTPGAGPVVALRPGVHAEPFGHDPSGDGRGPHRAGAAALDEHGDRDRWPRLRLGGSETDEPRVRRGLAAELRGAGLAGAQRPRRPVQLDVRLAGEDAPEVAVDS